MIWTTWCSSINPGKWGTCHPRRPFSITHVKSGSLLFFDKQDGKVSFVNQKKRLSELFPFNGGSKNSCCVVCAIAVCRLQQPCSHIHSSFPLSYSSWCPLSWWMQTRLKGDRWGIQERKFGCYESFSWCPFHNNFPKICPNTSF